VTPLWPRANGDMENFMKNLGKVLKTAVIEKQPRQSTLQAFLKAYRDTPHTSTGVPPAILMMGGARSSDIPQQRVTNEAALQRQLEWHKQAQKNDAKAKEKIMGIG
jgi:hypothetical protein